MFPLRPCHRAIPYPMFALMLLPLMPCALSAQEAGVRASLFREADAHLAEAQQARADLLSPESFEEGMKYYGEAERDLERGRDLEGIRRKLRTASQYFRKAIETTKVASVAIHPALAARDDAEAAGAGTHSERLWREGERKFREAAREVEDGDVNDARRRAAEAEGLFREAELEAIKTNYLQDAWERLREAERMEVRKWAPRTLERAERLVREAESKLGESRYDTDEPRSLAQQARYEAQHAIFLASQIRGVERGHTTVESMMLLSEDAVRRIAAELDLAVSFEEGLDGPAHAILERIRIQQDSLSTLNSRLQERQQQIAALEGRVEELEGQLGGIAAERTELVRRMDAQARIRERFATVEGIFEPEEGRVLREGDRVIVRLYGLTFPVAQATIEPQYFGLLSKVQRAITTFPDSRVTVEGHTDSFGSDEANLRLSKQRADAVRQYLIANMGLTPSRIEAIGYGEAQPIASNDTPEGRARNRRTDIVIHPDLGTANR